MSHSQVVNVGAEICSWLNLHLQGQRNQAKHIILADPHQRKDDGEVPRPEGDP